MRGVYDAVNTGDKVEVTMLIVDGKGRKITTDEYMYIVAERDFSQLPDDVFISVVHALEECVYNYIRTSPTGMIDKMYMETASVNGERVQLGGA